MFYRLDGDIIVLASGGGTSVEALDDLCLLGGQPAIFTEYSGNPTPEKVKGLTKIALMHPGPIHAIWVVGGRANFTDIYETLIGGIMGDIRETPNFDKTIPILIRRAGPRDEEAFATLHKLAIQEGYRIYLRGMATSVADSARMVIHQAKKHRAPLMKIADRQKYARCDPGHHGQTRPASVDGDARLRHARRRRRHARQGRAGRLRSARLRHHRRGDREAPRDQH